MKSGVLCAVLAVCGLGCDEDGSAAAATDLVGTWLRTVTLQPGTASEPEVDTWTVTFREDSTFIMTHMHDEVIGYTHFVDTYTREGTYTLGADSSISMTGDWVTNAGEVTTLTDLAAILMDFTQETTYVFASTGDVLFLGPDFNYDSVYYGGNSYNLLFSDGQSSYLREANLVLKNPAGEVVEQRLESYAYTLIDAENCSVAYTFDDYLLKPDWADPQVSEGTGTTTDCTYIYETGVTVDGLDGNQATVSAIQFTYLVDGAETVDDFAIIGDSVLISYLPSFQSEVLTENAFFKVAD